MELVTMGSNHAGFLAHMQEYFRAEKGIAFAMVALGLLTLAAAFWVWRVQEGGFRTGMMITLAIVGLGMAAGGAGLAIRTDGQVSALQALLASDPAALAAQELERMARVNANWPKLKVAWVALSLVTGLLILFVKKDWVTGVAVTLFVTVGVIMVVDVFASRRAYVYTSHLEALKAATGGVAATAPPEPGTPATAAPTD